MFAWTRQIFVHRALPTTKLLKYAVIDTIAQEVLNLLFDITETQIDAH